MHVKPPRIDIYNYKLCNGVISKISEIGITADMDVFIQKNSKSS